MSEPKNKGFKYSILAGLTVLLLVLVIMGIIKANADQNVQLFSYAYFYNDSDVNPRIYRYQSINVSPYGATNVLFPYYDAIEVQSSDGYTFNSWQNYSQYKFYSDLSVLIGYASMRHSSYSWIEYPNSGDSYRKDFVSSIKLPVGIQYPENWNTATYPKYSGSDSSAFADGTYCLNTQGNVVLFSTNYFRYFHDPDGSGFILVPNPNFSSNSYLTRVWDVSNNQWRDIVPEDDTIHISDILYCNVGTCYFRYIDDSNEFDESQLIPIDMGVGVLYTPFPEDVPATPTVTPTPTSDVVPSDDILNTFIFGLGNNNYYGYVMFDFIGSSFGGPVVNPDDYSLQWFQSTYNSSLNVLRYPFFLDDGSYYQRNWFYVTGSSDLRVKAYFFQNYSGSNNLDFYRETASSLDLSSSQSILGDFYFTLYDQDPGSDSAYCIFFTPSSSIKFVVNLVYYDFLYFSKSSTSVADVYGLTPFTPSNSSNYPYNLSLPFRLGYSEPDQNPDVSPTPSPTPTPEPTPTAYQVIPITPEPDYYHELPIDINDLDNPSMDLDDPAEAMDRFRDAFHQETTSIGIFALAFSFLPDKVQTLCWFVLFLFVMGGVLHLLLYHGGD